MTKETKETSSFDILGFDAVTPCETALELMMLQPDGITETGVKLLILGGNADKVKSFGKKFQKKIGLGFEMAKKKGKEIEFNSELIDSIEDRSIDGAANRAVGWVGVKQEFNEDLLKQVLTKNPHWCNQIVDFSENIGNFTK